MAIRNATLKQRTSSGYDEIHSTTNDANIVLSDVISDTETLPATSADTKQTAFKGLRWLATMIKNITGETNWFTKPAMTIKAIKTSLSGKLGATATAADSNKLGGVQSKQFIQTGTGLTNVVIPKPPESGTYNLQAIDGSIQWGQKWPE